MIDNLKLALEQGMTLTSVDTNIPENQPKTIDFAWDSFISGVYDDKNFVKTGYLTANGSNSSTSPNLDAWRQVDPGDSNTSLNQGSRNCDPQGSKINCGYLYNFYTVTASTTPQSQSDQYLTASGSICPAGWELPSGLLASSDKTNDFAKLDLTYTPGGTGTSHSLANPDAQGLWLLAGAWQGSFSGNYSISGLRGQGTHGYYWSSSVLSSSEIYYTYFLDSSVDPGVRIGNRFNGFAVRCLVE
jgi:uncharacterized protein (TIGR02145 family)